jgi:hypothetical protein
MSLRSIRQNKLVAGIVAAIVIDAFALLVACVVVAASWPYLALGVLLLFLFYLLDRSLSHKG